MSLLPSIGASMTKGGDIKTKIENIKKDMYLHPLKNRTPNVLNKDRKEKKEENEEDSGEDSPRKELQEMIESKNLNPTQLKKDFYAGKLDLLDSENLQNIVAILWRDKVPNFQSLVQTTKEQQIKKREY